MLDLVSHSDEDESVYRDAIAKSDGGNRSNRQCMRQSQKRIFVSEHRFKNDIPAVNNKVNQYGSIRSYAAECD